METIIRVLSDEDLRAVKELSRLFWDGEDYLGKIAKTWIHDGGFYGLFEGTRLLGCAKMSRLPDRVLWLEGLRVHPDFQRRGLGKHLSGYVLEAALRLVKTGIADFIEFSTYYLNLESIHIAAQCGFKQIDEHVFLTRKPVKPSAPSHQMRIHDDVLDYFPASIPYGWKFLHPVRQSVKWLNQRTSLYRMGAGYFYVSGEQPAVCLLSPAGEWIEQALPCIQYLLGKKQEIHLMLNTTRKFEVEALMSLGFHWWDNDKEDRVLVFRHQP